MVVVHHLASVYVKTSGLDHPDRVRAWKLFCLLPRMLLCKNKRGGKSGTRELRARITLFNAGKWDVLLRAADITPESNGNYSKDAGSNFKKVDALIANAELSHGARLLQSDGIAEGSETTYQLLTNVQARPPRQLKLLDRKSHV